MPVSSGPVIVCVIDETPGPRDTDCPDQLHDRPLPGGYVAAAEVAAQRFYKGWANVECPRCGLYGWRPGREV